MRLLFAALLVFVFTTACMPRGPIIDNGERPPGVGGTISGEVRATGANVGVSGRKVTATEVTSGARHETTTSMTGGYTMKVPEGKYRLEVELRAGEMLTEQPGTTEINRSDLDASCDFRIAVKAG